MRSRRPRGVDLDRHDLTARAQQMRFLCVSVCGYFLWPDLWGCTEECVDVCETKGDGGCE